MGRQSGGSRQARRAQARRQQQQSERGSGSRPVTPSGRGTVIRRPVGGGPNWQLIAGLVVVLAAIGIFAWAVTHERGSSTTASGNSTPTTIGPGPTVNGIACDQGMSSGPSFHIHAHIAIYDKGKLQPISADYGHYYNKDCLFWLHAHDTAGIIHMESPHPIHPTLATWYQIAKLTLPSAGDKLPRITPRPGEQERAYVNQKLYHGNPMGIPLTKHENITIEFGPPWVAPKAFTFPAGY
jgi:hypothetical protein